MTRTISIASFFSLIPSVLLAHHSVSGFFDTDSIIEREGEVVAVYWRNPHVRFTVNVQNESGSIDLYEIETTSLVNLRRRKLTTDFLKTGDRIRIAGNPAKDEKLGIYALNILLPMGEEVILGGGGNRRWAGETIGNTQQNRLGDPSEPGLGIFRVWSTPLGSGPLYAGNFPLTEAASRSVESFDPAIDSPTLNCAPKGMPTIMEQPYPMLIREEDDTIVFEIEEYDTIRVIHMTSDTTSQTPETPRLGYSIGQWERETLVVETFNASWPHFNRDGIPLSSDASIIEYFDLAENGSQLNYRMTITDQANFTAPVTLEKHWVWYPEVTIEPYDCIF
ncbi:MAG: hypothetical protein CMM56_10825 [Rhodospirillaceae bacterium]|nr:hypothetical protein [Rhodospirillaceae bacterium]|tara:strand:+ start:6042 stop:7046 length:1005 start_codon:yes stop_codon:yes gene_type:complete